MNADKNIWIMYEREGRGHYVSFTEPTRQQKVSHAPVHYQLVNDAVAQMEEPPVEESGGGFDSHPASPKDLWKQIAYDVGISVEYLTNTKQIGMIEAFAEKLIIECATIALLEDHDPYECILKHFGIK